MFTKSLALTLLTAASAVQAHMHLYWPPTLKGDNNPFTQGQADPYLDYPYGCCGKAPPGPCKGHLGLLGTDEGKPVVTWQAGSKVNFTLAGIGNHYGGSCQVGFSTDQGKTFKVATSWEGDCPHRNSGNGPSGQSFDFNIPSDLPSGDDVVFAWTWVNREQEFNMGCAVVSIEGGGANTTTPTTTSVPSAAKSSGYAAATSVSTATLSSNQAQASSVYSVDNCSCQCPNKLGGQCQCDCPSNEKARRTERKIQARHFHVQKRHAAENVEERAATVAWTSRPDMLFSDYSGANCESTKTSAELKYPNPGPDVVQGDGEYPLELPTGSSCGNVA